MDNLWRKETTATGTQYVDMYAGLNGNQTDDEIEKASFKSHKDNQYSAELRIAGNVQFRLGCWQSAMNFYNRSLCYAELETGNVALGYANRSACFFELKMYSECLHDIKLARDSNVPNRFMCKLEERKRQCHVLMTSAKQVPKSTIKLSYDAHSEFHCMANVLEIKQSDEFGRHLVAKCDIAVGQTILIEDDFVSMQSNDEPFCYTCFRTKANFIACTQCPDVVFCSIDCLKRNQTHTLECGSFFAQLNYKMKFQLQAILLAIITFSNVESLMHFVEDCLLEEVHTLPTLHDQKTKYHFFLKLHASKLIASKYLRQTAQIYSDVINLPKIRTLFDTLQKQRFPMHLVIHHFVIIKTNSIVAGYPWSTISIFNVLSMLNHSCVPNLFHPRQGKRQYCVTIRPVKKGQQLFISYISLNDKLTIEERQFKLMSSWGFDCRCENCNPKERFDSSLITSDSTYRFLLEHYEHENNQNVLVLFEKCVEFLNRYGSMWSPEISTIAAILINLYIELLS